ncbi:MAG: tetratricopeptide repeat protein [Aquisalimonadaceae bacterium]
MASYNSDDEQLDVIRDWLKENGKAMVAGAVIAVAGVVGWQQWGAYQERAAESASIAYLQLIDARETGADPDTVDRRGRVVMDDHGRFVYAAMAGLQLADYHVGRGALDEAASALRWIVDNSDKDAFRHMARLRLAQVLIASDSHEEAMRVLDVPSMGSYRSQYLERRGDAHAALGRVEQAQEAYDQVLELEEVTNTRRTLIRLKRNDLAGETPA